MSKFTEEVDNLWKKFEQAVSNGYHKFLLPAVKALEAAELPVIADLGKQIGEFVEQGLAGGAKADKEFGHSVLDFALEAAKKCAPALTTGAVLSLAGSVLHAAAPAQGDTTNR